MIILRVPTMSLADLNAMAKAHPRRLAIAEDRALYWEDRDGTPHVYALASCDEDTSVVLEFSDMVFPLATGRMG